MHHMLANILIINVTLNISEYVVEMLGIAAQNIAIPV